MDRESSAADSAFERRKSGIGIRMTLIYSVVYAGFVVLSVFRPEWTGARALLGLNLALAYGLGLIVAAIVFALIYNHLCRPPSLPLPVEQQSMSAPDRDGRDGEEA